MTNEEWRPLPRFREMYEVSNRGRVRSLRRNQLHEMKLSTDKDGYKHLTVSMGERTYNIRVHRAVCEAFHGPPPIGTWTLHKDGNPANNTPENLYWGTPSENRFDAVRHGTHSEARKTHCPQGHCYDTENTVMDGRKRKCRICLRVKDARYRDNAKKRPVPSHLHGTRRGYDRHGCRCTECTKANTDFHRERRERIRKEKQ